MPTTTREKLAAIRDAALYRPRLVCAIVALSLVTALLEGIGLGFLLPIVEFSQSSSTLSNAGGIRGGFVRLYSFLGLPFTLEFLIAGLAAVMTLRFAISFLAGWLQAILRTDYQRDLRRRFFDSLAYGPIDYIDRVGSDDLLNSFITEINRAGITVEAFAEIVERILRGGIYLTVAALLSLELTVVAVLGLGTSTVLVRYVLEPAYTVGDAVADTNNRIQTITQSAVQGMRDIRLYNLRTEYLERMNDTLDEYFETKVRLIRNQTAMQNLNQLANALIIFGLVYGGIRHTRLSLAEVGVFLFAVFRLSPILSQLNNLVYSLDGQLPHLVRVQSRIRELEASATSDIGGGEPVESVDSVSFDTVSFSYEGGDTVLRDVSFALKRGDHIALVGRSGAGKSTIVSLLGRLQEPDSGLITANGTPISEFDVEQWRSNVAVVRQEPYIFDATLRENVTVGDRGASAEAVERACEIARVTEFLPELSDGYETELGENGVKLSGGQRQRVAIARALVTDADVLVLDEATSELDSNIERTVYDGIRGTDSQHATITISHRLSTVSEADRIYALADGSVVEVGTHSELVEMDGFYADLYAVQ